MFKKSPGIERFITILSIFSFYSSGIISQTHEYNFKMGAGIFTLDQFGKYKSNVAPENYTRKEALSRGALFISFSANISEKITSGAALGLDKVSGDIFVDNQHIGSLNRYLYTLAIETDFIIIKKENFQFYTIIGGGYSLGQDKYSSDAGEKKSGFIGFPVFQLSPLGLRFGNKLAFVAEFGFGYKGIVNLGLSYKFY